MASMVIVVTATRMGGKFFSSATIPVCSNVEFHAKKALYKEYPSDKFSNQGYILPKAFTEMVSRRRNTNC